MGRSLRCLVTERARRSGQKTGSVAENQVAFTVGVSILGAKMAKADGVVSNG